MKKRREEDLPRGTETILLVDDEHLTIEVVRDMLGRFGYTILAAENGAKAIDVYRSQGGRIDLVILDLNMPGMDGHACLNALLSINPGVKVIISSGYLAKGENSSLLESGALAFMAKPYSLKEILLRVREILDRPA